MGSAGRRRLRGGHPARGPRRRELDRHGGDLRARPLRGGRRPGPAGDAGGVAPVRLHQGRHDRRPRRIPTPRRTDDLAPASIRSEVEASLRRLGVERIDLYQFHWPDDTGRRDRGLAGRSWTGWSTTGKVRAAGLSNHGVGLLERAEQVRHVDSLQPPFSLIHRESGADVIPWAATHGTGVIVYSPMQSGLLTEAFSAERMASLAPDDWRRGTPTSGSRHCRGASRCATRCAPSRSGTGAPSRPSRSPGRLPGPASPARSSARDARAGRRLGRRRVAGPDRGRPRRDRGGDRAHRRRRRSNPPGHRDGGGTMTTESPAADRPQAPPPLRWRTTAASRPSTPRSEAGLPMRPVDEFGRLPASGSKATDTRPGRATSRPDWGPAGPDLVEAEVIESLATDHGIALPPGATRRNLTTRGIRLDALLGRRFRIGDVECLAVRRAEPCAYLEGMLGRAVLVPLVHRAGNPGGHPVSDGEIAVGMEISPLPGPAVRPRGDGPRRVRGGRPHGHRCLRPRRRAHRLEPSPPLPQALRRG